MGNVSEEVGLTIKRNALPHILVTGANGFVGRALCRSLVELGYPVTATVRALSALQDEPGFQTFQLELLRDDPAWRAAMAGADCVVHLAAHVHQMHARSQDMGRFHEVNTLGACFVAQRAVEAQVKRYILISSVKVNGEGREGVSYCANDVPQPQDAYARSKLAAEIGVRQICEANNLQFVCVRLPLVYGPGVAANFLRMMRLVELGLPLPFASVNNKRSLIGIQNLCSFIEVCAVNPIAAGATWLVSDGEDISTPELLRRLSRHLQRSSRLFSLPSSALRFLGRLFGKQEEMARLCGSLQINIEPALRLLNWRPPMSLDDGLALTATAFQSRRHKKAVK